MVKIPFVPRSVFVQSFFSPLRANPPGGPATEPVQPNVLQSNCGCIRCRLGRIHARLVTLALKASPPLDDEIGELVLDLGALMLDRGEK